MSAIPTLGAFAAGWLVRIASRMRATSAAVYADHVQRFLMPRFGERPLDKIRRADVVDATGEWLQARGKASVSLTLCILRQLYYDAMDAELVEANPAARFDRHLGKIVADRAPVPAPLIAPALAAIRARQPAAARILLFQHQTGLRLGEALGVRWCDVEGETLRVRRQWYSRLGREGDATKDGKPRVIPLTPLALEQLDGWDRSTIYVHTNPETGLPFAHGFVQRWWRYGRRAVSMPEHCTPHSLRHTFGTVLIEAQVPDRVVQRLLGHSDPRQTYHYTRHAAPPVPPEFAAALAIGRKPPLAMVPITPRGVRRRAS